MWKGTTRGRTRRSENFSPTGNCCLSRNLSPVDACLPSLAEAFAVWVQPTQRGLQRLRPGYQPRSSPGAGNLKLPRLLRRGDGPNAGLRDPAGTARRRPGRRRSGGDREEMAWRAAADRSVWLFQANPEIFDVDTVRRRGADVSWSVASTAVGRHGRPCLHLARRYRRRGDRDRDGHDEPEERAECRQPISARAGGADETRTRVMLEIEEVLPTRSCGQTCSNTLCSNSSA